MALKCVAIDDEPLALELIKNYVSRIPELELSHVFDNAISGIEYLNKNKTDILLLDINMPDITGIELVEHLKEKTVVIFTTAYRQFAYEGFELEATDYLLKPISFDRLKKAIQKAIDFYNYKNADYINTSADLKEHIYVQSEYKMVKINISDIEYIESMGDYIRIHLLNEKPVMTLVPLKKILEKLPSDKFKRIHRSHIIAVDKIKSFKNRKISLSGIELPVSDSYIDDFREWIYKHRNG